jgi:hypothetical protein
MEKLNRSHWDDIWAMRNLTVKEFIEGLSKHPDLKFLLTVAGIWWLTRTVVVITFSANVIYCIFRVFNLVLG